MKNNRWAWCGVIVMALVTVGMSVWLLRGNCTMGEDERRVVEDVRLAPEIFFDPTCTNSHAYIDNVFRRIVELPEDRPRKAYVHEFMDSICSMDMERHCRLNKGTREQWNESLNAYAHAHKVLGHAAWRGYEALARLNAPERERWGMYWQYLVKYGKEEQRILRIFPKHEGDYSFEVRTYEEDFIRRAAKGKFSTNEYQLIRLDFENAMGRPLRTLEQIQSERDEWCRKNILESKKSREGK